MLPVDYLAIDIPSILRAEWGPADETLKHNCAKRPLYPGPLALLARWKGGGGEIFAYPVTVKRVTISRKDLRGNIYGTLVPCRRDWHERFCNNLTVWCANSRISHQSARLSPLVDLCAVADGQADLVDVDGVSIEILRIARWTIRAAVQKLVIVVVIMQLSEAG